MFTRSSPASTSPRTRAARPLAVGGRERDTPGAAARAARRMSARAFRRSGSPPVNRTSVMPSRSTATRTTRPISSGVSRSSRGIAGSPSAGMQYVHRSEHFSVMEMRRSRATRPYRSTSASVAGRAGSRSSGVPEGTAGRTLGIPSETAVMGRS